MVTDYTFENDRTKIPQVLDFIRNCLYEKKMSRKNSVAPLLTAEEILENICRVAEKDSLIRVSVFGFLSNVTIKYNAHGGEFTLEDVQQVLLFDNTSDLDSDKKDAMNTLMEKLFGSNLSIKCDRGRIHVRQEVKKSSYSELVITLLSLILGIITGLILQNAVSPDTAAFFSNNIFSPVYSILMNALKMIVSPLVFFSIASSIAEFSDIRALGRIAGKIVIMYIVTSILAIGIGLLTYNIFPIGNPSLAMAVDADAAAATITNGESASISIIDTLVGIVPTDIITPFHKSDMLQIIFMAVCLGLSAASLSKTAPVVKDLIVGLNNAFSKATGVIVSFMPLMVFCSMAKMMLNMNLSSFMHVIIWLPVVYISDVFMIIVYMILLLAFAQLNPIKFLSKYYPAMISAFTSSSSNATLPISIKQCKKLGISEKIYSFSLPLGATINMDGNCITLIISALFLARIYQLPMAGSMLLQLFIAIIVLSVGAPGVPGGNIVCLALLIPQIGVPAEAISLLIGLYPIISMMQTMTNVTGDAVVTCIASKGEKMLDIGEFNK